MRRTKRSKCAVPHSGGKCGKLWKKYVKTQHSGTQPCGSSNRNNLTGRCCWSAKCLALTLLHVLVASSIFTPFNDKRHKWLVQYFLIWVLIMLTRKLLTITASRFGGCKTYLYLYMHICKKIPQKSKEIYMTRLLIFAFHIYICWQLFWRIMRQGHDKEFLLSIAILECLGYSFYYPSFCLK